MLVYVPFRARNSGGDYWLPAVHGDDVIMPPVIFFTKICDSYSCTYVY